MSYVDYSSKIKTQGSVCTGLYRICTPLKVDKNNGNELLQIQISITTFIEYVYICEIVYATEMQNCLVIFDKLLINNLIYNKIKSILLLYIKPKQRWLAFVGNPILF